MNQLSGSECKAESKILHLLQFKPIPTKHLLQWYIIKCGFRCLGVTCTLDAFSCGYLNHLRNLSATQKLKTFFSKSCTEFPVIQGKLDG